MKCVHIPFKLIVFIGSNQQPMGSISAFEKRVSDYHSIS